MLSKVKIFASDTLRINRFPQFLGIYTDVLNFSQIDIHCQIYYNRNECMQESHV